MKLEGLKVVDLSWFLPGPYLTTALADHGADVIKIEPPGEGDPGRHIRPIDQRTSVFFRNMGRGKKSVVLDLKSEQGRADLFRLACEADVLVESFRPGVAARFGIGYEAVSEKNPGIVYCSISAFGQDGAYPGRAAHDLALEAMTGVLSLTLGDDGRPAIPGIPVADLVSGLHGLSGVLMALLRRQTTGKGDYIDVSMHEALMASCANVVGTAFTDSKQPDVKQQRTTGGSAFYRVYDTSDGRQLVLAGQEMKFMQNLLGALGKPEMAPLVRMARPAPEAGDGLSRRDLPREAAGALDEVARHARHLLRPGQHAARGDRRSQSRQARRRRDRSRRPQALRPRRALPGRAVTAALSRAVAGRAHGASVGRVAGNTKLSSERSEAFGTGASRRSAQDGFAASTSASFFDRFHPLICFSRVMASSICSNSSATRGVCT